MAYLIEIHKYTNQELDIMNTPESQKLANAEYEQFVESLNVRDFHHPFTEGLQHPKPSTYQLVTDIDAADFKPMMCIGSSTTLVSETVRQEIERVEPGVHRFYEVEFTLSSGETVPEAYYILNICTRLKAIDAEKSEIHIRKYPPEQSKHISFDREVHFDFKASAYDGRAVRLFVNKDMVRGREVWAEDGFSKSYYFVSDDFYEFVMAQGGFGAGEANEYVEEV